ncbi:rCG48967 [Rattus norvegicus]|uniref:RCG48967 n=1 Tax=Rattus norvegicus TaxID=10116 RepID=A6IG26_RAT|nr:rCG48967 [Rattus norvegicus]
MRGSRSQDPGSNGLQRRPWAPAPGRLPGLADRSFPHHGPATGCCVFFPSHPKSAQLWIGIVLLQSVADYLGSYLDQAYSTASWHVDHCSILCCCTLREEETASCKNYLQGVERTLVVLASP